MLYYYYCTFTVCTILFITVFWIKHLLSLSFTHKHTHWTWWGARATKRRGCIADTRHCLFTETSLHGHGSGAKPTSNLFVFYCMSSMILFNFNLLLFIINFCWSLFWYCSLFFSPSSFEQQVNIETYFWWARVKYCKDSKQLSSY